MSDSGWLPVGQPDNDWRDRKVSVNGATLCMEVWEAASGYTWAVSAGSTTLKRGPLTISDFAPSADAAMAEVDAWLRGVAEGLLAILG